MSDQTVIHALKAALADSYALYLKTQNYHWNVEGPQFKDIHELLETHYTDLALAIDELAEMIRGLGEKAPGTWKAFASLTQIEDGNETADAQSMLKHLVKDQTLILNTLQKGAVSAQKAGDEVVAGALIQRMAVHRKNHWMLASMLK